jgi:hypothetical protein
VWLRKNNVINNGMKKSGLFGVLLVCLLLASCQQNISGTYKAINPSDQLEKELIIIDWDGDRYFEKAMIGHANELYTDESQRPNRHARIEYDYRAYVKGKLEKQGKKYIASDLKAGIEYMQHFCTFATEFEFKRIQNE